MFPILATTACSQQRFNHERLGSLGGHLSGLVNVHLNDSQNIRLLTIHGEKPHNHNGSWYESDILLDI